MYPSSSLSPAPWIPTAGHHFRLMLLLLICAFLTVFLTARNLTHRHLLTAPKLAERFPPLLWSIFRFFFFKSFHEKTSHAPVLRNWSKTSAPIILLFVLHPEAVRVWTNWRACAIWKISSSVSFLKQLKPRPRFREMMRWLECPASHTHTHTRTHTHTHESELCCSVFLCEIQTSTIEFEETVYSLRGKTSSSNKFQVCWSLKCGLMHCTTSVWALTYYFIPLKNGVSHRFIVHQSFTHYPNKPASLSVFRLQRLVIERNESWLSRTKERK